MTEGETPTRRATSPIFKYLFVLSVGITIRARVPLTPANRFSLDRSRVASLTLRDYSKVCVFRNPLSGRNESSSSRFRGGSMHSQAALRALRAVSVIAFVAVVSLIASAQSTGGRILGRVADPSGAVLAGVNVKLVNEQTGVTQNDKTDKDGNYQFPTVSVGNYRLEFDQTGFKKAVKRGLTLQVNQVITMNMVMQVGGAQEVVEVTSEAPLVETTSRQLGAVVNERSVAELLLNG